MRQLLILLSLVVAGSASEGALAAPCAGFVDVDSTSSFCTSVAWIKSRGVTLGCTDASHYCPNDSVTRLQMAAFMYRLGFQNALLAGGNAFGTTAVLGTTDNNAVEIKVAGTRVMRYEPTATSPNVIGGSPNNSADSFGGQTIAGGGMAGSNCDDPPTGLLNRSCGNQARQGFATVGGGYANIASGNEATVGGGRSNTAGLLGFQSFGATVGGGQNNTASGDFATVGAGVGNTASGLGATVGGGSGNIAAGGDATVPGGFENQALGVNSFAAGQDAVVPHNHSFVWCDGHALCLSQEDNDFIVVASGGIKFYAADGLGGCILTNPAGSGWVCSSDRNLKENFEALDGEDVLRRVAAMPVTRWNVKGVPSRHIGPVSQDFYAAFGLGEDDLHIASGDLSGVALAAIRGLNAKLEARLVEKEQQLVAQQQEIAELRERIKQLESLRGELAALRTAIAASTKGTDIAAQVDATAP